MKDLVLQTTANLPDNATIEDILDAILVNLSIKKGLDDFENGDYVTHEELLKEMKTW